MSYACPVARSIPQWSDADTGLADLLRRYPDGLTRCQISRLSGLRRVAVDHALCRLECRGVLLCEDDAGRVSVYQE